MSLPVSSKITARRYNLKLDLRCPLVSKVTMASLQLMEEEDRKYVKTRKEIVKDWICSKKYSIILTSFLAFAFGLILYIHFHHQSHQLKLHAKMDAMEDKLAKSLEHSKKAQEDSKNKIENVRADLNKTIVEKSAFHLNQTKMMNSDLERKINSKIDEVSEKHQNLSKHQDFHVKAASPSTCQELQNYGYSENGVYLIDPDGRYQGNAAFYVYCNFVYGTTNILVHPNSKTFNITSLKNDHLIPIEYETSFENIQTLIRNSVSCYQEITFDCNAMPLHSVELNHGFWRDKYGVERYFFDGSDMNSRNCKCSNDGQCQGKQDALCYCDLTSKLGMQDKGRITADWLLPISEFGYRFFGHSRNGFGRVTIGDIICTGEFWRWISAGMIS